MRIGAIQHDISWEDGDATRARLVAPIKAAASAGSELIVVSEMFASGFSMNTATVAEPMDGPSFEFLAQQAREHDAVLVGSISTNHPDYERPINRLVVVGPDGLLGDYAKIHPFSFSGEDTHYSAGSDFLTLNLHGVRCTFFVCYDLRFADEFWVNASSTDLFVVVANWPEARRHHWQSLLLARAIENQAYVLGVNRVGLAGHPDDAQRLPHSGDSMLIDPLGERLATAASTETVLLGEAHAATVADVRARFPFQNDRR